MDKRTPQSQDKFIIRLPDGMRDQIKEAAEASNRTMTAEIVSRLEASFAIGGDDLGSGDLGKRVAELERALVTLLGSLGDLSDKVEKKGGR